MHDSPLQRCQKKKYTCSLMNLCHLKFSCAVLAGVDFSECCEEGERGPPNEEEDVSGQPTLFCFVVKLILPEQVGSRACSLCSGRRMCISMSGLLW